MTSPVKTTKVPHPTSRRLRAFAFDPGLSRRFDTHGVNEVTIQLPWEDSLAIGPVDDYLEVVDCDPASQAFYPPVDLNVPYLLAQDGLPPSEGNPQFHQQMVYAVARTTIGHFERALGRPALWSPAERGEGDGYAYVDRLRIYPHALREANAYYSSAKKALLFGYFPASLTDPGDNLPGGMVFTCLSHDIVAHETTHALLDGLHRRFIEPSNVDVWALHEAFADIVALFQHFTYPGVLRHAIASTRGSLERQNILAELAYEFGQAIGHYGALRNALGKVDRDTKAWVPEEPDPTKLPRTTEPHARGAILLAAVFEAFLTIYRWRTADLLRIATGGTGILPPGDLHPDLVERLAQEASKTAGHILNICIRALDYCPPVDVDFGDYLRALITADVDLVADDRLNYRLAIIEAFRRRGIYPRDVRALSVGSLLWDEPVGDQQAAFGELFRDRASLLWPTPGWRVVAIPESVDDAEEACRPRRERIYEHARARQRKLHGRLTTPGVLNDDLAAALFLDDDAPLYLDSDAPPTFYRPYGRTDGPPALEVHSVRPAYRVGPDGHELAQIVIEMTQRRRGYYSPDHQLEADAGNQKRLSKPDFIHRGGCTLLVDIETGNVRYCVYKRIRSENRLDRMRRFLTGGGSPSLHATYFGDPARRYYSQFLVDAAEARAEFEPFALLHRSYERQEEP